jgi:concanavalin A-like lectin/glucanase superfamily protein
MNVASACKQIGNAAAVLGLAGLCHCSLLFDLSALDQGQSSADVSPGNEGGISQDEGSDVGLTVIDVAPSEAQGDADATIEAMATSGDAANGTQDEPESPIDAQNATSNPGDAVADANDAASGEKDVGSEQDSSSCVPITSGLLGHWTMDRSSVNGTQLIDSSGHGNNGTLVGFPTPATVAGGKFPQVLAYPSSGADVNIPTLALDQSPGGINSVSLWYLRGSNASVDDILVFMPQSKRYDLWLTQTSALFLCIDTGGNDCYGVQDSTLLDRWVHVVAMFSNGPSVQSRLYIDGTNANPTCQSSGFAPCNAQITATAPVLLGGPSPFYFQGWLAEVRIYNRALMASEVTALYNGTACP